MVVWIIGLSGSGKTTLANETIKHIHKNDRNIVLIDGDVIREIFGNDLGYSIEERRINADRICQLCKFLERQNVSVICAILSIFPESQQWNRENYHNYYEVFIDTPVENLIARDPKGIYKKYLSGDIKNVAGMDLEFPRPNADLVIENTLSKDDLLRFAKPIASKIMAENL